MSRDYYSTDGTRQFYELIREYEPWQPPGADYVRTIPLPDYNEQETIYFPKPVRNVKIFWVPRNRMVSPGGDTLESTYYTYRLTDKPNAGTYVQLNFNRRWNYKHIKVIAE